MIIMWVGAVNVCVEIHLFGVITNFCDELWFLVMNTFKYDFGWNDIYEEITVKLAISCKKTLYIDLMLESPTCSRLIFILAEKS